MKKLNRREFIELLLVAGVALVIPKLSETKLHSEESVYTSKWITMGDGPMDDIKLHELAESSSKNADVDANFNSLVQGISSDRVIASARHGVRKLYVSDAYKRYAEAAGHEPLAEVEKQIAILDYTIDNNGHLC